MKYSAFLLLGTLVYAQEVAPLRPPAVPLVTHDPYLSVWSIDDHLTDNWTNHWTGKMHSLYGLARVDGKLYRALGKARWDGTPALEQKRLEVLPTRTLYEFAGAGIRLGLTFFTPALPHDLDVLSRPVTYVEWTVAATDGKTHDVQLYFDAGSELVINSVDQYVNWSRFQLDGQTVLRMGSREQRILAKRGDDLRIDWGYLYLMADRQEGTTAYAGAFNLSRNSFRDSGVLPISDDLTDPVPTRRGTPAVLALSFALGHVGAQPMTRYALIGYDDLYSIEYFQRRLRPWWRRKGAEMSDLLRTALKEHDSLLKSSVAFDEELMADLRRAGGERYARLAALAYRQTLAAHKLAADLNGTPMFFPKENLSNGCISTVDVIYPSAPFTLLFNPRLLRAQLQPVLDYSQMGRWKWAYAPHDLGTYPQANGQVYGGGEESEGTQMPVEETGNMLLMVAALARVEGDASFAQGYWPLLTHWAEYLRAKGLDPEDQLSTDDFAGHLAHNANLSIKAILALGAYGQLCDATGHKKEAAEYTKLAKEFARQWVALARDGDHYKLAFDKPGTWSMKYNLVWDSLLGLNLFPADVARTELTFYQRKLNRYGLPLDSRKEYTKLDWTYWIASLADDRATFEQLTGPAYRWANETASRVPLPDWYGTVSGLQESTSCQARSVVGGLFIQLLKDREVWRKYALRSASGL